VKYKPPQPQSYSAETAALITQLKDRIKRLEDRIHRASMAFFRDGSDGQVASQMLAILEEERGKP
jgi:hypothetical protein